MGEYKTKKKSKRKPSLNSKCTQQHKNKPTTKLTITDDFTFLKENTNKEGSSSANNCL